MTTTRTDHLISCRFTDHLQTTGQDRAIIVRAKPTVCHRPPSYGFQVGLRILGWPRLTTPGWLQGVRSSRQMPLAELCGDGLKRFYPNHFLTWEAAAALQHV